MPSDRAAAIRCLIALAVLCAASIALFEAATHDLRHAVATVRATPTPAFAAASVRP
jgi:hypothetical protein